MTSTSYCLSPFIAEFAEIEAEKVAGFLKAEPAANGGTGETSRFRYTFTRKGTQAVILRIFIFLKDGTNRFSGEVETVWA